MMKFELIEKTEKVVEEIYFENSTAILSCTDGEEILWEEMDVLAQAMVCVNNGCYDEAHEWLDACADHAAESDVFGLLYTAVKAYVEAGEAD